MNWRRDEIERLGIDVAWLPSQEAARVYTNATAKASIERYGLSEAYWDICLRFNVKHDGASAISSELDSVLGKEFFVVYGPNDVFLIRKYEFIAHWANIFTPSRDDVIIIPEDEGWCLFYCHEDEFEFGKRK